MTAKRPQAGVRRRKRLLAQRIDEFRAVRDKQHLEKFERWRKEQREEVEEREAREAAAARAAEAFWREIISEEEEDEFSWRWVCLEEDEEEQLWRGIYAGREPGEWLRRPPAPPGFASPGASG